MPLQKIETIDEPRARAEAQGQLFDTQKAHLDDFRNMLVWGDNKLVMASLLKEFKGRIDHVYIDPPFDVGADFTMEGRPCSVERARHIYGELSNGACCAESPG